MEHLAADNKLHRASREPVFQSLDRIDREFIADRARDLRLSYQDIRKLANVASDLRSWDEGPLWTLWPQERPTGNPAALRKSVLAEVFGEWERLRSLPKSYEGFGGERGDVPRHRIAGIETVSSDDTILGRCPVASEKTRCCNLMTVDAVKNCGFGCSYCTIQTFYGGDTVVLDEDFGDKLRALPIDPTRRYHIGTGQSSDSLMWGNRNGILDDLLEFAREHPNVALELKTKSHNVHHLLDVDIPANVICTWSLNTPTIIDNEEHGTASLQERLGAARKIAERRGLVGFHFHPMIVYDGWEADYTRVIETVVDTFSPDEVALVSLGAMTLIKPVVRNIRKRGLKTKVLQMPLENAQGKLSYPLETKQRLFEIAYRAFEPWHNRVYFYLCMEDDTLWKPVFGWQYPTNEDFERSMLDAYFGKIDTISQFRT